MYKDLGGYVVVIEDIEDVNELKNHKIDMTSNSTIYEYIDTIDCINEIWFNILVLKSSDFSVSIIIKEKMYNELNKIVE